MCVCVCVCVWDGGGWLGTGLILTSLLKFYISLDPKSSVAQNYGNAEFRPSLKLLF